MAKVFVLNRGVWCKEKIGEGIEEYRVGDEVLLRDGRSKTIATLTPRHPGKLGTPCHVQFTDGTACCVLMLKPGNPDRITFGVVLLTNGWRPWKLTGSAQRYTTHLEAEQEIARLREVGYQGLIEVITEEPHNNAALTGAR